MFVNTVLPRLAPSAAPRKSEVTRWGSGGREAIGSRDEDVAIRTEIASLTSAIVGTIDSMNEEHFAEIEKTLLFISEARKRAERAAAGLESDGAEAHLVAALRQTERELEELGRRLMQQTYFAVPKDQLSIDPNEALTLP